MTQKKLHNMAELLERLINDPDSSIERIESVNEMVKEERRRDAQAAFSDALRSVQRDVALVAADAENKQTRSKYATYAKLDAALRPSYTRHGFSVSFNTLPGAPEECVRVEAIMDHEGGFSRSYTVDMPVVTTGIKGETNMTKTHGTASAQSYGMRYLLKMIFNVAIGEDDDDGNGPSAEVSEDQVKELSSLLSEYLRHKHGDDAEGAQKTSDALFSWMSRELKASSFEALNQNAYGRVKEMLDRKIEQAKRDNKEQA